MRLKEMLRATAYTLLVAGIFGVVGCSEDDPTPPTTEETTVLGDSQTLGDGYARLYVVLDEDDNPVEFGIRISENALTNLPDTSTGHFHTLEFQPMAEASATPFDFVTLDWNPAGHEPPGIYDLPHFDMHFYTITETERALINPTALGDSAMAAKGRNFPDAKYLWPGYFTPDSAAIPFMGVHWLDMNAPELQPGTTFTETMIFGTFDGDFIFVEPMMTRAWLMTKPSHSETLPAPTAYDETGYWPTTYNVYFDADSGEYVISLGDMVGRTAS